MSQKAVVARYTAALNALGELWWRRYPDRTNQYPDMVVLCEWATAEIQQLWEVLATISANLKPGKLPPSSEQMRFQMDTIRQQANIVPPELVKAVQESSQNEPGGNAEYPQSLLDLAGYDERQDRLENPRPG